QGGEHPGVVVAEGRGIRHAHAGDASDACDGGGDIGDPFSGHQHIHRPELGNGVDGPGGGRRELAEVVLGEDEDSHQRNSISATSPEIAAASSDMEARRRPPARSPGGTTSSTVNRGARSTPKAAAGRTSSGFWRAFITIGSPALRGVLRRRSAVATAGSGREKLARP